MVNGQLIVMLRQEVIQPHGCRIVFEDPCWPEFVFSKAFEAEHSGVRCNCSRSSLTRTPKSSFVLAILQSPEKLGGFCLNSSLGLAPMALTFGSNQCFRSGAARAAR